MHYAYYGKRIFRNAVHDMGENMTQNSDQCLSLAMALRDFFSAGCASDLADTVPALRAGGPLSEEELRELEFEFNRLFVGPDHVPAPPFASVYLEKEPQLMGRTTLEVRELYLGLGLAVPEGGVPDDFLPYELDAWVRLSVLGGEVADENAREAVCEARRWLVHEHMVLWLPAFLGRAMGASPSDIMADMLKTLENWLQNAKENV